MPCSLSVAENSGFSVCNLAMLNFEKEYRSFIFNQGAGCISYDAKSRVCGERCNPRQVWYENSDFFFC